MRFEVPCHALVMAEAEEVYRQIHVARLDAELRVRYTRRLAQRREGGHSTPGVVPAVVASSGFVTWAAGLPAGYAAWVSIAATIVASVNGTMIANSPVAGWKALSGSWTERLAAWELLRIEIQSGRNVSLE